MTQDPMDLLGKTGSDKITGLTGIILAYSFHLTGCTQIFVQPGKGKDGKIEEGAWLDIQRCSLNKKAKRVVLDNEADPGADIPMPRSGRRRP